MTMKKKAPKTPSAAKESRLILEWVDMIEAYPQSLRHHKGAYLEVDEVYGGEDGFMEVALYSSNEIYVSYGKMHCVISSDAENQIALRKSIREELENEYLKSGEEPSAFFMKAFSKKYDGPLSEGPFLQLFIG